MSTVLARDLAPGQVIRHEQGDVEVLTVPELKEDGRVYFDARNHKGKVETHRSQPEMDFEVSR